MADMSIQNRLERYRIENGFLGKIPCSGTENQEYAALRKARQPLPEDVFEYYDVSGMGANAFYRVRKEAMDPGEMRELILYKQLKELKTIKGCLVFFVVSFILGIIVALLLIT